MTAGLRRSAVAFSMAALLAVQPVVAVAAPMVAAGAQQEQPAGASQEPVPAEPQEGATETPAAGADDQQPAEGETPEPKAAEEKPAGEQQTPTAGDEQISTATVSTEQELINAIANAQDGAVITLGGNITLAKTLTINKSITLNGANHAITGTVPGDENNKTSFINVTTSGDFTLENVTLNPTGKVWSNGFVNLAVAGTTTIKNVVFGDKDAKSGATEENRPIYNAIEFAQSQTSSATIEGCTFYGASMRHNGINVYRPAQGSVITVKNNTFNGFESTFSSPMRLSNYDNADFTVNADGNTYHAILHEGSEHDAGFMLLQKAGATAEDGFSAHLKVNVTNHTQDGTTNLLYTFKWIGEGENKQPGYGAVAVPQIDGDETISKLVTNYGSDAVAQTAVVEVDGKHYYSIQAAIDAGVSNVVLLRDITENVVVSEGKTVTFDLNGHTLSGGTVASKAALTNNGGAVTITDTSEKKTGVIKRDDAGQKGYYVILNDVGTMTIKNGTVENDTGSGDEGASLVCNGLNGEATLKVAGGKFKHSRIAVKNDEHGTLDITAGTIEATDGGQAVQNWSTATITGGTLNGRVATWTYTSGNKSTNATTTIKGGTVNGTVDSINYDNKSNAPVVSIESGATVKGELRTLVPGTGENAGKYVPTTEDNKAKIAVSGGLFSEKVDERFCAGGFAPAADKNAEGMYGVQVQNQSAATASATLNGTTQYFGSLSDAVRNAAAKSTITLMKSSSESVDVSKELHFTASGDSVMYSGQIKFDNKADGSTVKGMHFEQKADPKVDANIRIQSASNVVIGGEGEKDGNTFKIDSEATGQPNSIIIAAWGIVGTDDWAVAAKDNKVLNNTFDIECSKESSSVAVNLQGSAVDGVTLSKNTVKVANTGNTGHNAFFLIGINSDKEKGTMDKITVSDNKFSADDAAKSAANFVGLSGVQSVTGTKNAVSNANQGFGVTSWQGVSHQNEKVSLSGNSYTNVTNPVNVKSPESDKTTSTFTGASVKTTTDQGATTKDYATFDEAIKAAKDGDTVTLLGASSENVTVDDKITVTAASKDFAYTGKMTVKAGDVKVQNMAFELDPKNANAQNVVVSNGADGVEVSSNTFTIKSGKSDLSGTDKDDKTWQPSSVWLEGGAKNTKVQVNTFNIGQVWDESAVGVNLVGGENAISGTQITGNEVTAGPAYENGNSGSMMFVVANGNLKAADGKYGVTNLTVNNNTVDGTKSSGRTYGVSISDVDGLTATGNTFSKNYTGISYSTWGAEGHYSGNALDYYDPLPQSSTNLAISGNTFTDNIASIYFKAPSKADKNNQLVPEKDISYGNGNTVGVATYDKAAVPVAPANTVFVGWYTDAALTQPATDSTNGQVYAQFVSISEVLNFKGGSLRMDAEQGDYSKASLRFGYGLRMPAGTTLTGWQWTWGPTDSSKTATVNATNRVLNEDGSASSNLVITGVPQNEFKTDISVMTTLTYTTVNGQSVTLKTPVDVRSVAGVAQTIVKHPLASSTEQAYAQGLISAIDSGTKNE